MVKGGMVLGVLLLSMTVTGCGGGSATRSASAGTSTALSASTSASTARSPAAPGGDVSPSCHAVTFSDFRRVGATAPSKVEQLANSVGQRRICSDLFIDASGGLVLEITKVPGGLAKLAAARQTARGHSAGTRPRALPAIPGGFIAGQQVGFPDRGQVVSLSTGYTNQGEPELSASQLVRLASMVARR